MSLRIPPPRPAARMDVSLAIVNIVLLLIFFFLITGRLDPPESRAVDLSRTETLPIDRLPPPVLIVPPEGDWLLDNNPITPELLSVGLEAIAPDKPVHLVIARDTAADDLVALLARPELASRTVRLVTLREAAP